ncbi:MAG: ATP-grasp domain-containing protein [Mesorhizobium sp.]|uniref:ATP-grasp domain-containing protein n=1 Tax=unclassified Mesorhizobium TaxID=325217 RepID=UPI000FD3C8EA|nr:MULTISPECIES: acetyl-CoA carboxylase biotin carboxylase subunit family protein [unclassified Mesorhizobium]TGU88448.1 ATP-grasp domain-containing protein [Mesorhizobium sp. M00.F.Ca.ET.151.01.1.1]TGV56110.1 ATP-grasp domain-containing protein [bacterium M00.F.Ca.ET.141.01.1.1]RUW81666.1 ATP-grasp domain-containing protein [Mesorhizobium sp. M2A.F.Ca.ET.067.02.1.1]RWB85659.1 MAG: ATP-grasp domain-containing protein [Mesorhizobium sp.]RWD77097.1 MAG: ATP-grasp domain-containing protein [Mesor
MARKALILIEGHRGNGQLYVQAAQRLGLHPITLSADPTQYEYLAAENLQTIRVDIDNLDALIQECSRLHATFGIAGITGFAGHDESVSATVGKLCRCFDLPGPDPASIEQCYDKFVQRQLLAEAGVAIPAYRLAANATDVESSAAEIGLPVIVKPAVGSGSMGVRLCRSPDELAEHTAYLLEGRHIWRSPPRVLVEEFAEGPAYVAAVMGHEVVGIVAADYHPPPHFVYRECTFPAPLTDEEHERMADVSLSCLPALGLDWGPKSVELRLTKRGPVVIEVNPRLSGAPTPLLIKLAHGVDLITEHIKLVIGDEPNLRKRDSRTAVGRFLVADSDGTLDWTDGAGRAAALLGVAEIRLYVKSKAPIVRKGDYRDCIGHVVAASPTYAQTEAIVQRAVASIGWSITPLPTVDEREKA